MKRHAATGNSALAVAYIRVSTAEQELGPEAQRAAIEKWATARSITIASWHVDQGVSGGAEFDKRPALQSAFDSLRECSGGFIVVAKRDRIARDVMIAAMIERLAQRAGAQVVSAAGEGEGTADDPGSLLMRRMIDVFAEYERALIRSRTKAALGVKKNRGERIGTIPFGRRIGSDGKTLERHDAEEAIIHRVRELRTAGMSIRNIVARLATEGVVGRSAKPLCKAAIENLLSRGAEWQQSA